MALCLNDSSAEEFMDVIRQYIDTKRISLVDTKLKGNAVLKVSAWLVSVPRCLQMK